MMTFWVGWTVTCGVSLVYAIRNYLFVKEDLRAAILAEQNGVIMHEIHWRVRNTLKAIGIGASGLVAAFIFFIDFFVIPGPSVLVPELLFFLSLGPFLFMWKQIDDNHSHEILLHMLKKEHYSKK